MSLEAAILGLTAELKRFNDWNDARNAQTSGKPAGAVDSPQEQKTEKPAVTGAEKAAEKPAAKPAAEKSAPKAPKEAKEITVQELMSLAGTFATVHGAEGRDKLIAVLKTYGAAKTSLLDKAHYAKFKAELEASIAAKKAEQEQAEA